MSLAVHPAALATDDDGGADVAVAAVLDASVDGSREVHPTVTAAMTAALNSPRIRP